MMPLSLICPVCNVKTLSLNSNPDSDGENWCCACGSSFQGNKNYVDLLNTSDDRTSEHYTLQWGKQLNFFGFVQKTDGSKNVMPSAKLGWNALFEEIRDGTRSGPVTVYDAGCGAGIIAQELISEQTCGNLTYVGADIHGALIDFLSRIPLLADCGILFRWDISHPLPVNLKFDYVICRATLHHTPDPRTTLHSLCSHLKPDGKLAVSVYNKKALCREALDDALRKLIVSMSPEKAMKVSREFTVLGKAFQDLQNTILIPEDLAFLGIPAGEHDVHQLIYYYFLKCFYNELFGQDYSTVVNFDWYHPPFAYRFSAEAIKQLFTDCSLHVVQHVSIPSQHYLVGSLKSS